MDRLGKELSTRIQILLDVRQMSRAEFGERIARGAPWVSEFFNGIQTTNDLRLTFRMARVLGVPSASC